MKNLIALFAFLLISAQVIFAQEKIYMPFFEVINLKKDFKVSTAHLLKIYIDNENKYELILPSNDTTYRKENKDQAIAIAKEMKINHILIGELNKLGNAVIVSVTMFKTETGEKEWGTVQKAANPDDLDPIMNKIAQAISGKITVAEATDIYNVTDAESKKLNKVKANKSFGVELGGGTSFLNISNNSTAGFSVVWSGDARKYIYDFKISTYPVDGLKLFSTSIHLYYPFSTKDFSPYLGGGVGFGGTYTKAKQVETTNYYSYAPAYNNNWGLTLYGGGGLVFMRTSNVSLRFNANLFYAMYKVDGSYPSGILIGVAVMF